MAVYVRLLRYLRPYRWQVLAGLACLLVATPLSLLHPWIWKYIVDEVVTHRRPDLLGPQLPKDGDLGSGEKDLKRGRGHKQSEKP